jgi:hypothetical protein
MYVMQIIYFVDSKQSFKIPCSFAIDNKGFIKHCLYFYCLTRTGGGRCGFLGARLGRGTNIVKVRPKQRDVSSAQSLTRTLALNGSSVEERVDESQAWGHNHYDRQIYCFEDPSLLQGNALVKRLLKTSN